LYLFEKARASEARAIILLYPGKASEGIQVVTRTHGLQSWIDRLTHAELPALAAVVHDLQRLTAEHGASVQQLADVLSRDATLITKVLRVANSAITTRPASRSGPCPGPSS